MTEDKPSAKEMLARAISACGKAQEACQAESDKYLDDHDHVKYMDAMRSAAEECDSVAGQLAARYSIIEENQP